MRRQSRISDRSQLELRIIHRSDMVPRVALFLDDKLRLGGQALNSVNETLVSPGQDGRSTG
jgi:hypothetical protein